MPGVLDPADPQRSETTLTGLPAVGRNGTATDGAASVEADRPVPWARSRGVQILAYVALALGVGAVAGVVWWQIVELPGYLVGRDGSAATTERGLSQFVGGDAWFSLVGAVVGLLLGWLGWVRLRLLGWPVVLIVAVTAVTAALTCWFVGYHAGPSDFNQRLADAQPGDVVLIQLTLRAKAALLVWPFAATVPVLLGSSLGRDDEEPRPRSHEPLSRPPVFTRPSLGSRFSGSGFRRRSSRPEQP